MYAVIKKSKTFNRDKNIVKKQIKHFTMESKFKLCKNNMFLNKLRLFEIITVYTSMDHLILYIMHVQL